MARLRIAIVFILLTAVPGFASPTLYLPDLGTLEAGWSRHFLHDGIRHFNNGEYIYALEDLDNAVTNAPNSGTAALAHIYKARSFYGLKNYTKARDELDAALRAAPQSGFAFAAAGTAAFQANRIAEAQDYFQRGLKIAPHHDLLLNNFAWFRATCPDTAYRNGAESVRFATEACELAHWKDSAFLDTLAAAQAESANFAAAVATEQRALSEKDAERIERAAAEARLRLYSRQQPYRAKSGR